ncbi:unnamed protein product [Ceratitis capitata]|uniref:(Mediterranean fruit fly) hypothetical protein n=1 Tax=Ceratitis capitata TaxID=7213 RepID=A0A811UUK6_CERCA|nr:unnamed protein product [Ceratitis capitata]
MTSGLFLIILVLFWTNKHASVAQEENAFTLLFGSESSLQDVIEDTDEIERQLDAMKGTTDLQKDFTDLIERFEKLENTLTNQEDNFLRKLESFFDDNLDTQSGILTQQLKTDQQILLDKMATLQVAVTAELQQSEVNFLVGLQKNDA